MTENNTFCNKKDQFGEQCTREKGHSGICMNDKRYFVAGWIDQGKRPARRNFFTWLVCVFGMVGILSWMITISWYGWIALGLMSVVFLMGAGQVKRMYLEYQNERRR